VRFILLCCTMYRGYDCLLWFYMYVSLGYFGRRPEGGAWDPAAPAIPQSPFEVLVIVVIRLGSRLLRNPIYASVLSCFLVDQTYVDPSYPQRRVETVILT